MSRMAKAGSVALALLLAACGSVSKAPPEPAADLPSDSGRPVVKPPAAVKKPPVVQKRGGGYYKDDGPGDEIPDGLDEVVDAEPRNEPLHRFANRPYVVFGREYVPNTRVKPYKTRGIGSWYGKKFHGQRTSIGEPYDMFAMTAAHPTLAIPSYAKVTNLANGRSVIVRVTDRGPFHAGRVIDLSYAAAHRLDYVRGGSAEVEVEAIVPEATSAIAFAAPREASSRENSAASPAASPAAEREDLANLVSRLAVEERPVQPAAAIGLAGNGGALPPGNVLLQLGAFANADNAETLRQRMSRELDWADAALHVNVDKGIHRLHLGPYPNRAAAEKVAERIRQDYGFRPTFVTR